MLATPGVSDLSPHGDSGEYRNITDVVKFVAYDTRSE